jgi:hypothetical protein
VTDPEIAAVFTSSDPSLGPLPASFVDRECETVIIEPSESTSSEADFALQVQEFDSAEVLIRARSRKLPTVPRVSVTTRAAWGRQVLMWLALLVYLLGALF